MTSNLIAIIALIITIVLGVLALIKRYKPELSFVKESSSYKNTLENDPYKNKEKTITIFRVWNSGNKELRKTDISSKTPIQIKLDEDFKMLSIKITKLNNPDNNIHLIKKPILSKMPKQIELEYLNSNDGFICEVIHTGKNKNIKLLGSVIGSPKSPVKGTNKYIRYRINKITFYSIFISVYIIYIYLLFWFAHIFDASSPEEIKEAINKNVISEITIKFIFLGFYISAIWGLLYYAARPGKEKLLPKSLAGKVDK